MSPAVSVVLFSILFPTKGWVTPTQPINIDVRADAPITLVLTDFTGKPLEPQESAQVNEHRQVDVKKLFPGLMFSGTYVLYAVPKDMDPSKYIGTPLVIDVREDTRREAPPGPMITRIEPLQYMTIGTDKGEMTAIFYYDSAPATVENFIRLASDGFYDGMDFFRVVPGMLIETGDPRGDGTGGPGYHIEAEFNNRQHIEGVLSMARQVDPVEKPGILPRPQFANSAGSQFFICLDYRATQQLDRRYTAFGIVVIGQEVMHAIGASPVGGTTGDVPKTPAIISKVQIHSVTAESNPYGEMLSFAKPLIMPSAGSATVPTKKESEPRK